MPILQELHPDIRTSAAIAFLEDSGFQFTEVIVQPFSPVVGMLVDNLDLPPNSRLLCVVRHDRPITETYGVFLQEEDRVLVMTRDEIAVQQKFSLNAS